MAALLQLKDRIIGSIMGVFIGDALGVGVHWQYDLDVLERERGFVTDYLDPLPGTFHSGTPDAPAPGTLKAGQLEQQGVIDKLLLESLATYGALNQSDFLRRLEDTILLGDSTMDGTRQGGRYGWTDKSICDIYKARIMEGKPWEDCVPPRSDTPDSIIRAALIGALYFQTPREMAVQVQTHARYATMDSSVQSHAVAFASMVAATLDADLPLDDTLSTALYNQAGKALPFSTMYSSKDNDPTYGTYSEPDSMLWFGQIAKGVKANQDYLPSKAHRGVLLYGQFCAFFASLPSAYYCVARFPNSFEDSILCSINGGGQTTMRSSLVGALVGAKVGLQGIPSRFLQGLEDHEYLLALASSVADVAVARSNSSDAWNWPRNNKDGEHGLPVGKLDKNSEQRIDGNLNAIDSIGGWHFRGDTPFSLSGFGKYNPDGSDGRLIPAAFVLGVALAFLIPSAYKRGVRSIASRRRSHQYEVIA
ncbi:ADP-ribosylglycohydrolase [Seminavis robusta]|uniref:ADP-ribosylhydrolase ARH3 n=1 Tax=Seminavis robusta TaxID=568900 RepID=A0A9N8E213_9STRA|nr:ADP-ribosylglycohydrolase [Seminavis robusta]|eukprot:Sro568_g168180.1 ADP-ribosylglycohydrolase (477) ;mRNA; f:32407-33837